MDGNFDISAMERLRWLVCREFGVLPGSAPLSDGDYLKCGLNMLMDRQAASPLNNSEFDEARFSALKGGDA